MIEFIVFLQVVIVIGAPLFFIHINKRVGSYASEVGKITALSSKIEDIVEQQKQITKATEETKANISHLAWSKRESQTIKRSKLEKYLEEIFRILDTMRNNVEKANKSENLEIEYLPITLIAKLTTIQMLYLPELEEENKAFTSLIDKFDSVYGEFTSKNIDIHEFEKKMLENFALLGSTTKSISLKSQDVIKVMLDT